MTLKIIQQINQMFDKIQMILMMKTSISNNRISRLNYTLINKNNGVELMFLFNIGLSHLINKLSLISNENLLVPRARNEGS